MPDDAAILGQVQAAFAQCERPEHFTDRNHCEECAEHDELLRSRVPDTLRIADVANPGWDPLCYVDATGFGYFFPGLARLALAAPDPEHGWYGSQLLYHLTYAPQGEANRHHEGFSPDQRRAVAALLRHIDATRQQLTEEWGCREELMHAIALWSAEAEPRNAADSR